MSLKSILILLLTVTCVSFQSDAQDVPIAEKGLLNLRSMDLSKKKIPLNGYWIYYDHQFIPPAQVDYRNSNVAFFPGIWNDFRNSTSGLGYSTYALKIIAPQSPQVLALDIPQLYSSYEVWVNGNRIASNGKIAQTAEETTPQWLPQTVTFESRQDTINLVLHIANFHHHKGGSKDPIYIGGATYLEGIRTWVVRSNVAEFIILTLIAVGFTLVFFTKANKKIILYFSLLCLTWSIRVMFSNQYVFISIFPDFPWELMVKIEYLTLYLTMIWGTLFLGRLFANESSKIVKYLLIGGNVFFILFTLFTPALSYTRWLPAYIGFSFIVIIYALVIVVTALINDRAGVLNVVLGVVLGLIIFGYDLFAYQGIFVYNSLVFSAGYVIIFMLLGIALLRHLQILKGSQASGELRFDDLYGK